MYTDSADSLAFLEKQQLDDGSFMGQASRSVDDFVAERQHPTIFFTALIASCLRHVPSSKTIRQQAISFLLQQKDSNGSWNYWQRASSTSHRYPYPNDLDDTACALLALHRTNPELIDGQMQAQLAQLLIATEVKPGGPYRTWLVQDDVSQKWSDVDIVVNANIGAFLHTQHTALPSLNAYIDGAIARQKLESPYYVGRVPTLYFLARWYRGPELARLKELVLHSLKDHELSSLHVAMLISAAHALRLPDSLIAGAQQRLRRQYQSDHWKAAALYVDPVIDGSQYYAGSEALTTAFALEALQVQPNRTQASRPSRKIDDTSIVLALASSTSLPVALRQPYMQAVQHIASASGHEQISQIANITAAAYGKTLQPHVLTAHNAGSLNGWIAYTIYDDFLDDEAKPEQLGVANYAHRQSLTSFYEALPDNYEFHGLVEKTFNTIDAANMWEVTNARCDPNEVLSHLELPDYRDYRQLAERSAGHMLASCGVLYALGYNSRSPELIALQRFFHHFIIAKQLNDDAHDWDNDIRHGHLSSVANLLLNNPRAPQKGTINENLGNLRELYWQSTIHDVAKLISRHVDAAEQALKEAKMTDSAQFLRWLQPLRQSAEIATHQSREAQKFIATFQADSKVAHV